MVAKNRLKTRQKLGKYQIERRIAEGGFASVYQAFDTIEGIHVALKILHVHLLGPEVVDDFRREARLAAKLDHPSILPVKDASMIDGLLVIALPLGRESLEDRLTRRISTRTALGYADQMLAAAAHAHRQRIVHCDIKPGNLLLDGQDRLRLADFGVAKVAQRTIKASGSGTLGYIAPEQAMGRPSARSDVFSLGLILWRMFSGCLPEWPYDWPPDGYSKLRQRLHADFVDLMRRAMEVNPRNRFRDAVQMLAAYQKIRPRAIRRPASRRTRTKQPGATQWEDVRRREFKRLYGRQLATRFECPRCGGPVSEAMGYCPWCGKHRRVHGQETRFPARCPRCKRGIKRDWRYCPWCWGAGFKEVSGLTYSDLRYEARCHNPRCRRKDLMPFMRYCPWCHRLARQKWKVVGSDQRCPSCRWGVVAGFWDYCPWCGKHLVAAR